MQIEHFALFVKNLEGTRAFYEKYFHAAAGKKYHNRTTSFRSYYLSFSGGTRLEIASQDDLLDAVKSDRTGYAHFAFSVGSKHDVDRLTERLRTDGFTIKSDPRTTGDGHYESVILDPENNEIEITV